jgi:hypothetical protein
MLNNKYFEIVKCNSAQAWKLRLWIIGLSLLLFFLILYSPFKPLFLYLGYSYSNGCPFYTLTGGIPCPTCGMGRGLASIIHLDTAHIFYNNPSSVFLYLLTFLGVVSVLVLSFFKFKVKMKKGALNLWPHFIILIAVVWILNILFGHQ